MLIYIWWVLCLKLFSKMHKNWSNRLWHDWSSLLSLSCSQFATLRRLSGDSQLQQLQQQQFAMGVGWGLWGCPCWLHLLGCRAAGLVVVVGVLLSTLIPTHTHTHTVTPSQSDVCTRNADAVGACQAHNVNKDMRSATPALAAAAAAAFAFPQLEKWCNACNAIAN